MQTLEVGHLRLVTGLDQHLVAGLDKGACAATKDGLLAEKVGLGFLLEGSLDDSGARPADALGPSEGDLLGLTIGVLLDKLDELGITDNTIVTYSTDNGPHFNTWPDAAITPFRSEKNTNWEGAWRVPSFIRWPEKIKAGTVLNGIASHQDMLPTLLAAAGDDDIKTKLLDGYALDGMTYKVHIDGFNLLPYLCGETDKSPRETVFYFSDDGELIAIRHNDWKTVLMEQRAKLLQIWMEPFVPLRAPTTTTSSTCRSSSASSSRAVTYLWCMNA